MEENVFWQFASTEILLKNFMMSFLNLFGKLIARFS
jgi:hypothetical protein